jgi:hypothetical protein
LSLRLFNACLALSWLMVVVGGWLVQPWIGLVAGGALLLVLTLLAVRMGGLYAPDKGAN